MRNILVLISILLTAISVSSQPRFTYDVDYEMNFDNREFYRSDFSNSMTIFGSRLTPAIGLETQSDDYMNQKIMVGIDVMKDFGSDEVNKELFKEIVLYYNLEKSVKDTDISLYAGIFPRRAMMGDYSDAFFSDSLRFYDNNIEGILLRIRNQKTLWELGCDWMGQFGQVRKEKFMATNPPKGDGHRNGAVKQKYNELLQRFKQEHLEE